MEDKIRIQNLPKNIFLFVQSELISVIIQVFHYFVPLRLVKTLIFLEEDLKGKRKCQLVLEITTILPPFLKNSNYFSANTWKNDIKTILKSKNCWKFKNKFTFSQGPLALPYNQPVLCSTCTKLTCCHCENVFVSDAAKFTRPVLCPVW